MRRFLNFSQKFHYYSGYTFYDKRFKDTKREKIFVRSKSAQFKENIKKAYIPEYIHK